MAPPFPAFSVPRFDNLLFFSSIPSLFSRHLYLATSKMSSQPVDQSESNLYKLSNEILDMIVSLLSTRTIVAADPEGDAVKLARDRYVEPITRVSRHVRSIALRHLYHSVYVNLETIAPFARTMMQNPGLAQHVNAMYVNFTCYADRIDWEDVQEFYHRLENLVEGAGSYDAYTVGFETNLLWFTLRFVPGLQKLDIATIPPMFFSFAAPSLPNLHELRLTDWSRRWELDEFDLDWIARAAPNLDTMHLTGQIMYKHLHYREIANTLPPHDELIDLGIRNLIVNEVNDYQLLTCFHRLGSVTIKASDSSYILSLNNSLPTIFFTLDNTKNTLRHMHLEYIEGTTNPFTYWYLTNLKEYAALEELAISTEFMIGEPDEFEIHVDTPSTADPDEEQKAPEELLKNLPERIRKITLFKSTDTVDKQL